MDPAQPGLHADTSKKSCHPEETLDQARDQAVTCLLSLPHAVQESERQTYTHQHEVQHLQGNTAELRQTLKAAASKHQAGGSWVCLRPIPEATACHSYPDEMLSTWIAQHGTHSDASVEPPQLQRDLSAVQYDTHPTGFSF